MKDDRYYLALQGALGQGVALRPMLRRFGGAKELLLASEKERRDSGLFTKKQLERLASPDFETAERHMASCAENGWQIYTCADAAYPAPLRELPDLPAVLFCWGQMPDFENRLAVGLVGAREASKYALRAADYLAYGIASGGGIIVSGGALGVDSAAHTGALRAQGTTVAVLGCGFGANYLVGQAELRRSIAQTGAVLSEYPPGTNASRTTFPIRNRLISGLSDGVVVVEAGEKSGSLITARRAAEQGRDVFAVPGSIISHAYTGTNRLLADGALLALSPGMVLEFYGNQYDDLQPWQVRPLEDWQAAFQRPVVNGTEADRRMSEAFDLDQTDQEIAAVHAASEQAGSLPEPVRTIYNSLTDAYQHIDIIIKKSGQGGSAVLSALTQLELLGLAKSAAGKRYRKD